MAIQNSFNKYLNRVWINYHRMKNKWFCFGKAVRRNKITLFFVWRILYILKIAFLFSLAISQWMSNYEEKRISMWNLYSINYAMRKRFWGNYRPSNFSRSNFFCQGCVSLPFLYIDFMSSENFNKQKENCWKRLMDGNQLHRWKL